MRKTAAFTLLALLLIVSAHAEDMDLALDLQLPILLKVLTYDQNVEQRSPGGLTLVVVFSSKSAASMKVKDSFMPTVARLRLSAIDEKPVAWTFVDASQPGELAKMLRSERFAALYLTPGTSDFIPEVTRACQESQVTTLSGVSAYAEKGVSVAVAQDNGKPRIVVNLPSAKAEGSNFASSLLGLARVIR